MSHEVSTEEEGSWPTHCEECGTSLQSAQVRFAEAEFSEGRVGTPVRVDFCPNAECPRHDAELARAVGSDEEVLRNRPGSLGGDNGGG